MELHTEQHPIGNRPDWLPESVWPYPLHALDVDGRRMVYTDTGGDGPALLMVHVGMWSLLWNGLFAELTGRYRCVTLDVPGSGLSDPAPASLSRASAAIGELIDHLDLHDVTLVVHDTGGWATLAAVGFREARAERVAGLIAINTFGWKPRGMLRLALRFFGSAPMREATTLTGILAWASATRFGVGRHWDGATKRAWRRGLRDHDKRRFPHHMFADAVRDTTVSAAAERGVAMLTDRPTLTIFGQFGDYFRFRRHWGKLRSDLSDTTIPWGLHFPQSDNPALVADTLHAWHTSTLG
ncbi:alpha/beta hydrolase [Nocardia sp. NPDC050793]|uniref:alpha/beta fold hydrolase n=1 Tax=Nocardia sp. NPDC050793 TaxID=3155159 RepID=UPI0033F3AA1D